ncbi:MAG: SPOR domain-containing protein [Salinivirgaceae bacterium]|jgi:nucleoid DNA-binding protein|nr:SPOR domain-containing protein [Salinivirgaceae bacterium]
MINKYIAELLKTNTRVIIPDFGAFMVKSTPGSEEKQISFNDFLKYNDGLLVNFVAKKEGVIKDEAQKKVKAFVDNIMTELKANKPFKVDELGYLYKDPRGSVRFKAGNEKPEEKTETKTEPKPETKTTSTLSSAAKTSVTLDENTKAQNPQKVDEPVKKTESNVTPKAEGKSEASKTLNEKLSQNKTGTTTEQGKAQVRTGMPAARKTAVGAGGAPPKGGQPNAPKTAKAPEGGSKTGLIIISAAIVVVLGAAGVIGYMNWDNIKGWFGSDEPKEVVVDSAAILAKQARLDSIQQAQMIQDSIDRARQDSLRKVEEQKMKNQKKYYLVAGSFKTKKYADMFVEKLKSEGYNSEIFMERRGFYRVAYNSFIDRQEAFNEYRQMKNKDIEVWVLRH